MSFTEIFTPFNMTLGILLVASVFFMRGKVRADLVALCTLLSLLLLDILEPAEALAGFANSVVIMMVGLFIVGAGIFRTGLAKMISSHILKLAKGNMSLLFILVILTTAGVGAFVSNTGTVAVMMPIVISMAASSGISIRRYLMPMAFASSMGMFTLISTPPNLVIQDALINGGFEPLSFFSFAPIGLTALLVGILVLYPLSRKLHLREDPSVAENRGKSLSELVEEYSIAENTWKLRVTSGSPLINRRVGDLRIATTYLVSLVTIGRVPQSILNRILNNEVVGPYTVIYKGDSLYCRGSRENVEKFAEENNLKVEAMNAKEIAEKIGNIGIAEVFIMPNSRLINKTASENKFSEKYNVDVLGIKRQGDYKMSELKDMKLHAGDALLIQGEWKDILGLDNRQGDLVLVGQPEKEASKVTLDSKAPIAAAIMLGMVALMTLDLIPSVTAVLLAAVAMVVTGCIRNMEEAYRSINWSSIVLIGAMIPMATAFEKTGVTQTITDFLLQGPGDVGPFGLLCMIYLFTSLITLFLSNTATAVLFTPIAMHAAMSMGVSPYPFLFAVAVAASMCFASPYSTPPNALVMSAGKYTFMDYVKVGLPLQLITGAVMLFVIPWLFPFNP